MAYVLITPTRDEQEFIGHTIHSVIAQTVRPAEWIVVSDGSTDETNKIVTAASVDHPWIRLIELPPRSERNFAAVVRAAETGISSIKTKTYEYIGLLDSDVRFQSNYFECVLNAFEASPNLGLAGGVVIDKGSRRNKLPQNRQDVPGAVQFFRRICYEQLGGLLAIPEGGWDGLTCARTRMLGYETRLLTHLVVDHLKPRNISEGNVVRRKWQMGIRDHTIGYLSLFELIKCLSRVFEYPVLIGAVAMWIG